MGGTSLDHFYPPAPAQREAARASFGFAPTDIVCILAARLAWNKGHDLLIKAVRDLRERHPEYGFKCLFIGSGGADREAEIKALAHQGEADADTFRFVGFVKDVRDAMWASDVAVLPSRFEGFAISMVEAMATGLVPIRTPAGGATDQIVDGETGYIVPFEDSDALGAAILALADPVRRTEWATRNAERARKLFGIEPMVEQIMALYGLSPARAD
nr:glycosyltransferase family 4 protein [Sphingomonas yunnanensis]